MKGWKHECEEFHGVAWELRRVIENLLAKEQALSKRTRQDSDRWARYLDAASLKLATELIDSKKAATMKKRGVELPDYVKEEYQLTTKGLLALLVGLSQDSREKTRRDAAVVFFSGFLRRMLVAVEAVLSGVEAYLRAVMCAHDACPFRADGASSCNCVLPICDTCGGTEGTPESIIVVVCGMLFKQQETCVDSAKWYATLVENLAKIIDDEAEGADEDPLKFGEVVIRTASGKARRVDADYKRAVLNAAAGRMMAKTPQAMLRARGEFADSTADGWVIESLGRLRVAQLLSFKDAQAVGLAFDAGRFGQPKEDVLLVAACLPEKGLGAWLAPQVSQPVSTDVVMVEPPVQM